jgi:5-(carboxyamino)imidazole ribonucleotide synthase
MRIGIIGAGQLGLMLGRAGNEIGHECVFIDPSENPPAGAVGELIRAEFDDVGALNELVSRSDVITYEFENVPVNALLGLSTSVPVYPPPEALRQAQDRLLEKRLFDALQIPLPGYRVVDSKADLADAVLDLGLPLVVKTRRFGYDGKGQYLLREAQQVSEAWSELGEHALIVEAWVPFDYEVSVIGVRSPSGGIEIWPLSRNEHDDGILRASFAPLENRELSRRAAAFIERLLEHLDYVGVLALELFVAGDTLLANEFAPRVHNSGHWTIEGSENSQFTNHLLAISGQAPGPTNCSMHAGMVNLIGTIPSAARDIRDPRVTLHDYGKTARPGRKLGHITVVAETARERDDLALEIRQIVTQSTPA